MANLTFPQLSSGALAQYPLRRIALTRTVKNAMNDGTFIVAGDKAAQRLIWEMAYQELSAADIQALQNHFSTCAGPLRGFTFIDPTGNMLVESADLTASVWSRPTGLSIETGAADPQGGTGAFLLTNGNSGTVEFTQRVSAPAGYQYCFSLYARSLTPSSVTLFRAGANDAQNTVCPLTNDWLRIVSSGSLNDASIGLSVGLSVAAGQSLYLYGPQLEPQLAPSRFRPTFASGGVYQNAHWVNQELQVTAEAPNLFSTLVSIETGLGN